MSARAQLAADLAALGVRAGGALLVHSSLRAVGVRDPELVVAALLDALGPRGTLLVPALSWAQRPPLVHDTRSTPGCVGYLAEYVRARPGTRRSLHPTHSVCAIGADVGAWLDAHRDDTTPCGPRSPFALLADRGGQILMLGCGLGPNTSMHAIEELAPPPYLFGPPVTYQITDADGRTFEKVYTPHDFAGVEQRYERVAELLGEPALRRGLVGAAESYLIDAAALRAAALARLRAEPLAFVAPDGAERGHL